MAIKSFNLKAFSLLEVLLAGVIFAISVVGLFATLNSVRGPVTNKENQLAAVVLGKQVLEALNYNVNSTAPSFNTCQSVNGDGTCGDFALSVGPHEVSTATLQNVGNLGPAWTWPTVLAPPCNPYLSYTVSCADGSGNAICGAHVAHQVALSIKWPQSGVC